VDWISIGWRSAFASVHIVMEFHTQRAILLTEILLTSQLQYLFQKFFTHFPTKVPSDLTRRMPSLNLQ